MTKDFRPLFTWRSAIVESDLPPTTRHVALTMALHMNERGGSCYPSAQTLADETGLNVSTVRDHRRLLEARGWLACVERGGLKGERRVASSYEARIPDPSCSPTRRPPRPVGETALTPRPNRADPSSSPTPGLQEISSNSPSRERKRDLVFEALVDACGYRLEDLTKTQRGKVNAAAKELKGVQASPEMIRQRAGVYRMKFPGAALTPNALANNWASLTVAKVEANRPQEYDPRNDPTLNR